MVLLAGGVVLLSFFCSVLADASLSIYPVTSTVSAGGPEWTQAAEYDPTVLTPPAIPQGAGGAVQINLPAGGLPGMSIPQSGDFMGFSVELSVINQILGPSGQILMVPFLNLLANIKQRSGSVAIRVGGNTQETATLVPSGSIPGNKTLYKFEGNPNDPTYTPPLLYTIDILYAMANASALVNAKWFLGIPFNDTANPRLQIAEVGQRILGDNLLGLQLGNEPDLYNGNGHRGTDYNAQDYIQDLGVMIKDINADSAIQDKSMLIMPSTCCFWSAESLFQAGLLTDYASSMNMVAVQYYPNNNCKINGNIINPQDIFASYLSHNRIQAYMNQYRAAVAQTVAAGKKFIMMETNTASCGGFPGLSDSFGAALWGVDYGLQMAASNFSHAMMHVGGQSDFYNPFTAPPTNMSRTHGWTIGSMYYSALLIAEAIGSSGAAQVVDLEAANNSPNTPAYAIYENGQPARVVLINYVTDPSGNADYTANLAVPNTVNQVTVKYLEAPSTSTQQNFTWAGQTMGPIFGSDGRLQGNATFNTVTCNNGNCAVRVKSPSAAVVFLTQDALNESSDNGASTLTFSTSIVTGYAVTATVPQAVLATSNGIGPGFGVGPGMLLGSTSRGSGNSNAAFGGRAAMLGAAAWTAVAAGFVGVTMMFIGFR